MLPYIICHMMCSVDGRIKVDRWTPAFDGSDLKTIVAPYATISREYNAQARMLGQNTVNLDFIKEVFDHENCPSPAHYQPYKGLLDTDRVCIVLDSRGKTLYRENSIGGERIITVLGECVTERYLEHLQIFGISYVFAGSDGTDLRKAFITLKAEYGINTIVHHGGGTSNGILLKAGLIDELSVVIYPGVDGLIGMPTVLDLHGNEEDKLAMGTLELLGVRQLDHGCVWLRYALHKDVK